MQSHLISVRHTRRCVKLCSKLKDVISTSQHYPCQAIGVCPEMDEYGEVPSCKFAWKRASCAPSHACHRTRMFPLPKCDLNPGFKKWRQYTTIMANNVKAISAAVQRLPRCGEEGADENFCINEPTGVGLWCEYAGWILVFVVATFSSVRAIETPGGDDDRQWLTFWMMYFGFTFVERVSAVLLSWFPYYYQFKLAAMTWLIFFQGAAEIYRRVHGMFVWGRRKAKSWFPNSLAILFWEAPELTEAEYISELEKYSDYAVLKQVRLAKSFS